MNADSIIAGLRRHCQRMASFVAAAPCYSAFICVHLRFELLGCANATPPRGKPHRGEGCQPAKLHRRVAPLRAFHHWLAPVALATLAACTAASPQSRVDAETRAACRARADQLYEVRHRDMIYAAPQDSSTPFSGGYAPGVPSRGLSQLYEHDMIMRDCVRNAGPESDREPVGPSGAAVPPARP